MLSETVSPTDCSTTGANLLDVRPESIRKQLITKLRPFPFQYVWSLWHSRPSENYVPKQLFEKIADVGVFYKVFNNVPWNNVRVKDSVHIFRFGVQPLWEDVQNLNGGCWTVKVRREDGKALKMWEELCLMTCGGEIQAELATERDHVLGITYSPRLYWVHISIWTQQGKNDRSVETLQRVILSRLSPDLQPTEGEYYYKRHADHGDFQGTSPSDLGISKE